MARRSASGLLAGILIVALFGCGAVVHADTVLQSPNYQFEYTDLGGGGLNISSSSNYQSVLSTGDAAIGTSTSTNYQGEGGSQTTGDPSLTFTVNSGSANFGSFSATAAATATSTFSVLDYTSYGYVVDIIGTPPTYDGHTITAMATTGPSTPGHEQFGINLVKNAGFCGSGCDLGADPNHGQFGVGDAATNYNTPNQFRFVSGDTIAIGPKSSGLTTYTISYLVNVTGLTPGGQYLSDLSLVCIATY